MIDINITAAIQLVNFLVTLAALNYLLIRPVRETIRKRKELMSGLGREIDGFLEEAQTRLAGYEAALTKGSTGRGRGGRKSHSGARRPGRAGVHSGRTGFRTSRGGRGLCSLAQAGAGVCRRRPGQASRITFMVRRG